jgi:exosortase
LGLPLLLLGVAVRLLGTYYYFEWLDGASLVPTVAGICGLVGGFAAWKACGPGIVFLIFLLPLPYTLEVALAGPLQSLATSGSTFVFQTLGLPAVAEGNVILLEHVRIGVAEACSGLRMLVVFFAVCTAVAFVLRRPVWERLVVLASAVPIALIGNCVRIVVTGLMHLAVGREWADLVFHDLSGWLMMPLALGLVWMELAVLSRLLIEPPPRDVVPVLPVRGQALN